MYSYILVALTFTFYSCWITSDSFKESLWRDIQNSNNSGNQLLNLNYSGLKDYNNQSSIWVSMSLCWSEKARIYGKQKFPYNTAAELASILWRNVTDKEVRVALTIIYNEIEDIQSIQEFKRNLEKNEVLVILERASELGCVLQSQLSRMFLFTHPSVMEDDIILVSDVDIFIMNKRILEPLKKEYTTWIFR